MATKKEKGIVPITPEDVKNFLIQQFDYKFDDNDWSKSRIPYMYEIQKKSLPKSCLLSVKVPKPNEAGEAIHLTILYRDNNKKNPQYPYIIYPSEKNTGKKGLGNYDSKSIYRYDNWKQKLHLEAQTGIDLCESLFESETFVTDDKRKKIYRVAEERHDLIEQRMKNDERCKTLQRDTSKDKCLKESMELSVKIRELSDELNQFKSPKIQQQKNLQFNTELTQPRQLTQSVKKSNNTDSDIISPYYNKYKKNGRYFGVSIEELQRQAKKENMSINGLLGELEVNYIESQQD